MSILQTRLGQIRGVDHRGCRVYLGVRYGEPPKRFHSPVMAGGWEGVWEANEFPNRAMQEDKAGMLGQRIYGALSEDCLFMNIYTPGQRSSGLVPVMVWIHGGGFRGGSGNEYDGSVLAPQGNVVVITLNFRVGAFGHLDLSDQGPEFEGSASNGFKDMILALNWIRQNIEDYGGDPGNVTIFGESSGGSSVLGLLGAPAADCLFHKAIAHSATAAYRPSEDQSAAIADRLKIDADACAEHLMSMTAEEIVRSGLPAAITVDGSVITKSTADAIKARGEAGVPLIAGTNAREGTLYTLGKDEAQDYYPSLNDYLATDMLYGENPAWYQAALREFYFEASEGSIHEMIWTDMFRKICMDVAQLSALQGAGGWLYRFDLAPSLPETKHFGATHSSEMAFTFNAFGNPDTPSRIFHDRRDPVVKDLALKWSGTLIEFVRTGDPNGAGLPEWRIYDDSRSCLILDEYCYIADDPDKRHREFWTAVN